MSHTLFSEKPTSFFLKDLPHRPRRNRRTGAIRSLVQETRLHPNHFIAPMFILEGNNRQEGIHSMPEVYRYSIDLLVKEAEHLYSLGVQAVDLFPIIPKEKKDRVGGEALRQGNLIERAIKALKKALPELCVIVDIALDPFTDHGHDGLVDERGEIINDETLEVLGRMSLLAAEAGADIVAPSDMMDGRIGYIRSNLDENGFTEVGILAYAAKYASAFYSPFRDALSSSPKFGNKKTYQMNPANSREALLECLLDEWEAADMLLIKPGLPYLDIITKVKEQTLLPLGAFQVSGEFAMIKAAAQNGWINGQEVMYESLMAIKRSGADFILTYAAKEMGVLLKMMNGN